MSARDNHGGPGSSFVPGDLLEPLERALPGTSPQTLESLAESARIRRFAVDDLIFLQGAALPLALLLRGHGAYRRTTDDGRQLMVGVAGPGDLWGFASIAGSHSSVEMVGLTAGDAATWKGADVRRIAATDPGFALDAIDRMAVSITMITEKLDGFLHQDARRRVLRVLARHQDLFFAEPPILSRSHLPGFVGTTREMTGRVLRGLERDGTVVRVGRTGLRLLRPDQLEGERTQPPRSTFRSSH